MAPEVEGVAQVVEWRQVGEYAAGTDFVWLRRMNVVLDDAKKEATILHLPRIFVKDEAKAPAAAPGVAEAAGARAAKPLAARVELGGEKRLAEGAAWRWGEPRDEARRMGRLGWYRQVTITEKEGGVERKTNLTLPSFVWVGGETAKWPNAA